MKTFICILAIIAGANAGLLLGELLGGGGGNSGWSGNGGVNGGWTSNGWSSGGGGWSRGYGGGWNNGQSFAAPQKQIIKVIEAPAPIVQPTIVKIIKVIEKPSFASQGWAPPSYANQGWASPSYVSQGWASSQGWN